MVPPSGMQFIPAGLGYVKKPRITRTRIKKDTLTVFFSWTCRYLPSQKPNHPEERDKERDPCGCQVQSPTELTVVTSESLIVANGIDIKFKSSAQRHQRRTFTYWAADLTPVDMNRGNTISSIQFAETACSTGKLRCNHQRAARSQKYFICHKRESGKQCSIADIGCIWKAFREPAKKSSNRTGQFGNWRSRRTAFTLLLWKRTIIDWRKNLFGSSRRGFRRYCLRSRSKTSSISLRLAPPVAQEAMRKVWNPMIRRTAPKSGTKCAGWSFRAPGHKGTSIYFFPAAKSGLLRCFSSPYHLRIWLRRSALHSPIFHPVSLRKRINRGAHNRENTPREGLPHPSLFFFQESNLIVLLPFVQFKKCYPRKP